MAPRPPAGETSLHLRRAKEGDAESLSFVVAHLSPLLLAQARYRLRGAAAGACEPEDLVQDVWVTALPRLAELDARDGRETPVLVRFLATTLLNHVNNLTRRTLRRRAVRREADLPLTSGASGVGGAVDPTAEGVVTRVARDDTARAVTEAIEALEPAQRDLLVLRGIEQLDNVTVAELLGLTPNAASLRYARALAKLRARLPGSVFEELS